MTVPDAAYEAAHDAFIEIGPPGLALRAAVDAVWAIAYDAGHAAYMQQRRAEIAASLAEPGVADTEQALRARQDAILAEVRAEAREAGVAEGRRRAAAELMAYADNYPPDVFVPGGTSTDAVAGNAMRHAYLNAARIAAGEQP
jgi:hypothetical protein